MITGKFTSSAHLNVVTKSLLMFMQGQMQVTGRNIHIPYLASPYKNFGSLKGEKSPERDHVT